MNETIAVCILNSRVAPLYDSSGTCGIYQRGTNGWLCTECLDTSALEPGLRIGLFRERGVRRIVCGAITCESRQALCLAGIEVVAFVCGELDAVLEAVSAGSLMHRGFSMPGCGTPQRWRSHGEIPRACCRRQTGGKS